MNRAWFVTKGVMRLVITVLACLILAGLAYLAIIACIMLFPPPAVR